MADSSGQPTGAARRRRERRLRSMLRHEQQTVRMALAAALHHSAGPVVKKVELQQHAALRGQKTGTRAGGRVRCTRSTDAPRRQNAPHPGERPGCLVDPGPRRSDRTVRHSAGEAPSLLPPSLADAAADVVDHSSLAFLLKASLRQRRKEDEEEARKVEMEQVLAVKEQWRARRKVLEDEFMALLNLESRSSLQERRLQELLDALDAHDASKPSSGSSKRRKRKKRRKKKLPKCGLFPPGCGRPCDHRQVPALQVVHVREGAPASVHRQSGGHSCYACRDVYPQCELCSSSCAVPLPDIGDVGFGSSPYLDTNHTFYGLSLPSERGCPDFCGPLVLRECLRRGVVCGGGRRFSLLMVLIILLGTVLRPMTGNYFFNYFQYQEVR